MSFFLLRLSEGFTATNLNAEGFATGTLTIEVPPGLPVGAEYLVGIFATNGTLEQLPGGGSQLQRAEKDVYIKIIKPTEPVSGTQ
jgi:hypothetical protein